MGLSDLLLACVALVSVIYRKYSALSILVSLGFIPKASLEDSYFILLFFTPFCSVLRSELFCLRI